MYLLNNGILKAVCWTLVHSLWQGLALAVVAGIVISLTKKSPAALRYKLLTMITLVFIIGVVFTLNLEWSSAAEQQTGMDLVRFQNREGGTFTGNAATDASASFSMIETGVNLLNKYAGFVVVFWFVIFSVKFFRLLNGLQQVFRLRTHRTIVPDHSWLERFSELRLMMKVTEKVKLLESRLAIVPVVTGFLKPIILVPVGMLNNLPQDQVEAILLHELAHIRRSDYLYNLLQSFIDMLFFFNPGVLWVSSLIRDERENCCDDMAISVTQDKSQFVHALVSFQEYHQNRYMPAMQFGASRNQLLNRARRILMNNNKPLNLIEKSVLSMCLIVVIGCSFAFQGKSQKEIKNPVSHAVTALDEWGNRKDIPYADRAYDPADFEEGTCMKFNDVINGYSQPTYLFKIKDTLYQISGDVRLFKINGETIPQEKMKPYVSFIRTLLQQHQHQEAKLAETIVAADPNRRTEAPVVPELSILSELAEMPSMPEVARDRLREAAAATAPVCQKTETVTTTTTTETHTETSSDGKAQDPLIISILKDLNGEKVNLGKEKTIVSFKLESSELIINGVRQSEEILNKMVDKYARKKKMTIYYNFEASILPDVQPFGPVMEVVACKS